MNNDVIISELNNERIESMIYEIRGVKVMLDFDLARIYGYETKRLNEQVKNNITKFPERYRFKLTKEELYSLARSKKTTAQIWATNEGGRTTLPYAFTEQGIYMLMTVLKGDLATKQSIILIDTFKQMKDFLIESNKLLSINELIKLVNEQNDKFATKAELETIKNDLSILMDKFINIKNNYLFFKGERIEVDCFFQNVFSKAKHSIYIIDDYIDIKTLLLLKCVNTKVKIIIFTDNKGTNSLTKEFINDFKKDTNINLIIKENKELHDRVIVIDFNYKNEVIYHLGQSIKDSGNRVGGIDIISDRLKYSEIISKMIINNKELDLL
ncbi:MAG: ORF6N domain-containing protein [Acholeplasmatales bacterium]|nr:ORF6N domain-containing protein [Acholeplasmatales bacterium]